MVRQVLHKHGNIRPQLFRLGADQRQVDTALARLDLLDHNRQCPVTEQHILGVNADDMLLQQREALADESLGVTVALQAVDHVAIVQMGLEGRAIHILDEPQIFLRGFRAHPGHGLQGVAGVGGLHRVDDLLAGLHDIIVDFTAGVSGVIAIPQGTHGTRDVHAAVGAHFFRQFQLPVGVVQRRLAFLFIPGHHVAPDAHLADEQVVVTGALGVVPPHLPGG